MPRKPTTYAKSLRAFSHAPFRITTWVMVTDSEQLVIAAQRTITS